VPITDEMTAHAARQTRLAQVFYYSGVKFGGSGEVEEAVAHGASVAVDLFEALGEAHVPLRIIELGLYVEEALRESLPHACAPGRLVARVLLHRLSDLFPKLVVGKRPPCDAHDSKPAGQAPRDEQVEESGIEFTVGKIARRAEEDEDARLRRAPQVQPLAQGVFECLGGEEGEHVIKFP
jgi:hypothetical protein